jgi:hypothetical protein
MSDPRIVGIYLSTIIGSRQELEGDQDHKSIAPVYGTLELAEADQHAASRHGRKRNPARIYSCETSFGRAPLSCQAMNIDSFSPMDAPLGKALVRLYI